MFVCLNKVTCVRMYHYVQEYWKAEIKNLKVSLKNCSQQEALGLERKIKWMEETEMAVVISQEQNEIQTFKKWNLDIKTHRTKMEKCELDKEFKDSKNPLRVVLVCAMWLTGFDVKCLSCLYLDKPLKAEIDNLIRDTLWEELPECYDEVSISMYRRQIYEYVYTRYREIA